RCELQSPAQQCVEPGSRCVVDLGVRLEPHALRGLEHRHHRAGERADRELVRVAGALTEDVLHPIAVVGPHVDREPGTFRLEAPYPGMTLKLPARYRLRVPHSAKRDQSRPALWSSALV